MAFGCIFGTQFEVHSLYFVLHGYKVPQIVLELSKAYGSDISGTDTRGAGGIFLALALTLTYVTHITYRNA